MKCVVSSLLFIGFAAPVIASQPSDLQKLQEILRTARNTLPGERLEDLAEQASTYVRRTPNTFLLAQTDQLGCFGVSFLGTDYVDQPAKRSRELAARRSALNSVKDPNLAAAKARCLAELVGS